jgi:hypothetical protein
MNEVRPYEVFIRVKSQDVMPSPCLPLVVLATEGEGVLYSVTDRPVAAACRGVETNSAGTFHCQLCS